MNKTFINKEGLTLELNDNDFTASIIGTFHAKQNLVIP